MKRFYRVVTAYFDNGKVCASIDAIESDKRPVDTFESLPKYDRYVDYFESKAKAEKWYQDALNA